MSTVTVPHPAPAADEARLYARVTLRLVPFLFLCYILAYLDRVNVSFAKLQMMDDLVHDRALGDKVYGLGAGIFFIGYFIFQVPSNIILKRLGARVWIARLMIVWGAVSMSMMFVRSAWMFYLLRFGLGVAEAGFFPGVIYYLTCWYPARRRARITAWFMTALALAGVIGYPVSGVIMAQPPASLGLHGWQWLFLLEGLPSVLAGLAVYFCLDSSIEQARWLSAQEKALLQSNLDADNAAKRHVRLADAFASGRVWVLCVVYFFLMLGHYALTFWVPTLIKEDLHVKAFGKLGLLSAIPYGVAAVGMVLASWSSDRTGERRGHTAAATLLGAAGLVLFSVYRGQPVLAMACLSLGIAGVLAAMPLFWTLPSGFLTGAAAAAGIGIINSLGNLGGYVGPNVPTWVHDYLSVNPAMQFYLLAGGLVVAAALVLVVPATSPKRP